MYKHLTREQRYAIYLGKQKGETLEMIARSIGVHKSTVSREIRRNSTPNGKYVWNKAHDMAGSRLCHTPGNRGLDDVLKWRIIELIRNDQWSPRQIYELSAHGKAQVREEGQAFGKGRMETAAALQGRGAEVHHHGQRQRVRRA